MDIDPHKSLNPPASLGQVKGKKRLKKTDASTLASEDQGLTLFSGSELHKVIQDSLDAMPDVRRHLVEVGRELAEDPSYPSADELDELGRLALMHFTNDLNKEKGE